MSKGPLRLTLILCTLSLATPVQAINFFGFELFGSDDDEAEAQVEVIDPQPYAVRFEVPEGNEDIARRLQAASVLWQDRAQPAAGLSGLIGTARGDYRRLLATLYSTGRYAGVISIRINGEEASSISFDATVPDPAPVVIQVTPGPVFTFGDAILENAPPAARGDDVIEEEARVAFQAGEVAEAAAIEAAAEEAIRAWRELGFPKAQVVDREAVANHPAETLDVRVTLDPGVRARFGPVAVEGTRRMNPDFLRYMADIPEGREFDPDRVEEGLDRLRRLQVFRAVRISEAEEVLPDGTLPMTIEAQDRLPRRFGVGAAFSSLEGFGVEGFWLQRNLFGRAERLRFDASLAGIGRGDGLDDLDYGLSVLYTQPGALHPDMSFGIGAEVVQEVFETYEERRIAGRVGFDRIFTDDFRVSLFGVLSFSEVEEQSGQVETFTTLGLEARSFYDKRDDVTNATSGYYVEAEIFPFYELEFGNPALRSTIDLRAYRSLDADGRFVVAGRTLLGTIFGGPREELPTGELFFTGGGGSVRGFAFREIGVEIDGNVEGGRSLAELSGEFRARFGNFGGVLFADAGLVGEDPLLTGEEDLRVGVGAGFRYFTPVGPLRVDVAAPLDRREGESAVAFYIGIGQAF